MPLNKLENFIKNTEGRILYVNPNDLDATDSIDNQGNSLTKPFKTLQRALIESARFSYLRGNDNDITEKTTILLFPGEYIIDNRPGYGIRQSNSAARAVSPAGVETEAIAEFDLNLTSNFDITQSNNVLYKFNSIYGGVIVPRGTSIVGLDLRKTKIRPKYIPNPTDPNAKNTAIFRITGACYFWQLSIFDGIEIENVYTDPVDFSINNQSKPTFSHHKLTCFEYADGVNIPSQFDSTDLDMYYYKLTRAYNNASGRNVDQKYPDQPGGLAKQRPEWEIVGAFATDPINITSIISGDGSTPGAIVTVTTTYAHNLTTNTPVKIRGVNVNDYNISTKVQSVISDNRFTYLLPFVRDNLPAGSSAGLSASAATVTIETDTVSGASPYIFNCSLRSVWGMNGMHADGSIASGFRSMVVAQFTGVSLQKDDRSFVKYNPQSRTYDGINISKVTGSLLSSGSSSTSVSSVYHLDSGAIYRKGWQPSHIKISNDSFIQVVSVFAIGFHKHFDSRSGGDGSITNSNSNFGQHSLGCDGFKKESFDKDDRAFITSIVTPRAITSEETDIDWISLDVNKTKTVGISSHLYLFGFDKQDDIPPVITQGYRIGSRVNDKLYIDVDIDETTTNTYSASILMVDSITSNVSFGVDSSQKSYLASAPNSQSVINIGTNNIQNGERIRIISETGDLPENITNNKVYYAITAAANATRSDGILLTSQQIQIASSKTNADSSTPKYLTIYGGVQLKVLSLVSDKEAGNIGSPIQWDSSNLNWYIHVNTNNGIYNAINTLDPELLTERTDVAYLKRFEDNRSLDEKIYKVRVVIPKELENSRDPNDGFIVQESSTTGARSNSDFSLSSITASDYFYNRNPRFINNCSYDSINQIITVISDLPHNLKVGNQITVKNVTSSSNPGAVLNRGYNGVFLVEEIIDDKSFTYSATDVFGILHSPGSFTNDTNTRSITLPRFERTDGKGNFIIYRKEVISQYIYNVQDGVYYAYLINASNGIESEFSDLLYSQNIVDLYPQLDRDNKNDNPPASVSYAKRSPLGDVVTNDLKKSITKETIDKFNKFFDICPVITNVSSTATSATITLDREHGLGGVVTGTLTGGSGHTPGTYYNVKLYNNSGLTSWDGATAKVIVGAGGNVTSADIISGGSGYNSAENLYFDSAVIGGAPSAYYTTATSGISTAVGNTIQLTGITTVTDGFYRITSLPAKNQISIAKTSGDVTPVVGQYAINSNIRIDVSSISHDSLTGITTFTCFSRHGLVSGNQFRAINSTNNNLGDYIVLASTSLTTFTAKTSGFGSTPRYIFKHALSANEGVADDTGESLASRDSFFYDNEVMILDEDVQNQSNFSVSLFNGATALTKRFPLGCYIQIDNEIMRITSSTLSGPSSNQITVIRATMGTLKENHTNGSLIRKIKLIPIEFRRPSILRASGHTFEYLGYGPGNYSTGLPQLQVKTLTEREDFLAQSQETSGGSVIYTGMNSDGDFFIGNTKYSASSGQQITFDIPVPTITGQDPSRLSVVYDEVIIKERLLVEGGNSGTILSQFDGPVTFNGAVTFNTDLTVSGKLRVTNKTQSTSSGTGAVVVSGGVGISKNLNVNGNITGNNLITAGIGFVPDSDKGAYLGTSSLPFSDAYIGNIRIGVTNDQTIDTSSGNLVLNSATGSNVAINTTTTLSGNLTLTGNNVVPGPDSGTLTANYLAAPNVTPIGSIVIWAGRSDNLPSSPGITQWGICNGQTLNTYTYRTLHAVVSNTYGGTEYQAGVTDQPGATSTFSIPNLSNQFVIASNGDGGTNITGTTTRSGGSKDSQVITHNHGLSGDGGHPHGVTVASNSGVPISGSASGGDHPHSGTTGGQSVDHSHGFTTNPDGNHRHNYQRTGDSNKSMQPGSGVSVNQGDSSANTGSEGNHNHTGTTAGASSNHTHPVSIPSSGGHNHPISGSTGSHDHPGSTVTGTGAHIHTVDANGISGTNLNLPPYFALFYIMRLV
jgi:microcystin-dependent protein